MKFCSNQISIFYVLFIFFRHNSLKRQEIVDHLVKLKRRFWPWSCRRISYYQLTWGKGPAAGAEFVTSDNLQGFEPDFSFFLKASSSRIRLTIFWEGQICLKSWKNFFLKKPKKLPLTILQTWDCLTLEISSQEKAKWVWNVTITKIRLV